MIYDTTLTLTNKVTIMPQLETTIKLQRKTEGQVDLENALRKSNGNLKEIPETTTSEIKSWLEVGVGIKDIATHFGLSEGQVKWVNNPRRTTSSLPNGSAKSVTFSAKSISINQASYNYISSIKHLHNFTRGKVMDLLIVL